MNPPAWVEYAMKMFGDTKPVGIYVRHTGERWPPVEPDVPQHGFWRDAGLGIEQWVSP